LKNSGTFLIGFHVPVAGGFSAAVDYASDLGINCIQIFSKNPRGWSAKPIAGQDALDFKKKRAAAGIKYVIIHTCYLLNLASQDPALRKKSVFSLAEELERAKLLGADYLNTHVGSCKGCPPELGIKTVADSINEAFKLCVSSPMLLLENTSRLRPSIGGSFSDLGAIIGLVAEKKRLGVCLDTAHALGAGYEVRTGAGVKALLKEIESKMGLEKLRAVHFNDSKAPLGSGIDRHEHIGLGEIGKAGAAVLLKARALKSLPFIMETPKSKPEDDRKNLAVANKLRVFP